MANERNITPTEGQWADREKFLPEERIIKCWMLNC